MLDFLFIADCLASLVVRTLLGGVSYVEEGELAFLLLLTDYDVWLPARPTP